MATGVRLRVNFTKLLLSQNFCNRPLMRFTSFASNIGIAAAVPVGPAPAPLTTATVGNGGTVSMLCTLQPVMVGSESRLLLFVVQFGVMPLTPSLYHAPVTHIQVSCMNQSQTDSVVCKLLSLKLHIATL